MSVTKINGYEFIDAELVEFDGISSEPAVAPLGKARVYFNPNTNKLRQSVNGGAYSDIGSGGGGGTIPQYDTDPVSPAAEDAWVLRTVSGGGVGVAGVPMGLLLALTYSGGGTSSYQFSYRTNEGTTVRVSLT